MPDEIFPTEFARRQGEKTGLILKFKNNVDRFEYSQRIAMLQDFQKMALAADFEICLVAFSGLKLDKNRIADLKAIHKHTRLWAQGKIALAELT